MALVCALLGHVATHPEYPSEKSPIKVVSNQSRTDLRVYLCDAIARAKTSIFLSSFGVSDPYVIDLLSYKANQGVQVTLITDPSMAQGLKKNYLPKSIAT